MNSLASHWPSGWGKNWRLYAGLCLVLLTSLLGCAMTGSSVPPRNWVQFIDYEGFDDQLHDALSYAYPIVTVGFVPDSATVNQLPGRIERWLSRIDSGGAGRIEARPDPALPQERGFALAAIPLMIAAYQFADSWILYRPVGDYDALIYYAPGTGNLTRVLFLRRQPND